MGAIRPYKGRHRTTYRAEVWAHGVRDSATFDTRTDAKAWMAQREAELRAAAKPATNVATKATVSDLLDRYAEEVSPTIVTNDVDARRRRWGVVSMGGLMGIASTVCAKRLNLSAKTRSGIGGLGRQAHGKVKSEWMC